MEFIDREAEAELDGAFERSLLDSARFEGLPAATTHEAWRQFSGAMAAAAALHAGGSVATASLASGKLGAARVATKWLLIGAIGGSTLTAAWLRGTRDASSRDVGSATTAAPDVARREASPAGAVTATSAELLPAVTVGESDGMRRQPSSPDVNSTHTRAGSSPGVRAPARSPHARAIVEASKASGASTLAAQVALLDAARTASSVGAADDALRLIGEYHRDFPAGELSADADVVAIDVLAARGDRALAKEKAERFLSEHPNDPHAVHVREIARF